MTPSAAPARPRYEPTDLLKVEEVSDYLGLSRRTVERLPLPWARLSNRERRILFSSLVAFLKEREAAA